MRSACRAILALGLCLTPAASLAAQEDLAGAQRTLDQRDRGRMHPAEEPLELVGREQGGNDLRSRTPALARSDRVARRVDADAAYERALALHGEGATFHAPPAAERPAAPEEGVERPRGSRSVAGSPPVEVTSSPWWAVALPGFLLGLVALWGVYRRSSRNLRWKG